PIATQAIFLYTFSPFSLPRNNSLLLVPRILETWEAQRLTNQAFACLARLYSQMLRFPSRRHWSHVQARTGSLRTRSFGVFEVDLRAAELRKFGIKIKLQEQPFQLLALLLTHPGELVTRDELRQALWPEHTFGDRTSHVFQKTKTERDAAMADLLQTKALPMEG